jgi:hypothetical protein
VSAWKLLQAKRRLAPIIVGFSAISGLTVAAASGGTLDPIRPATIADAAGSGAQPAAGGTRPDEGRPAIIEARSEAGPTSPEMCPSGTLPHLRIAVFPQADAHGAVTPEAAVRSAGVAGPLTLTRFGPHAKAPVWIAAGAQTFFVTILADGTWFASPASLEGCATAPPRPVTPPSGPGPRG